MFGGAINTEPKDMFYKVDSWVVSQFEEYFRQRHCPYDLKKDLTNIDGYTEALYAFDHMRRVKAVTDKRIDNLRMALRDLGVIKD
jgi:hypothetical protein